MPASDDDLILEHLAYIRTVAEEIRQDVLAMFDCIERIIGSDA